MNWDGVGKRRGESCGLVYCYVAAARRYEVAGWLRSSLGAMVAKDMPAEPSEEEFILALRNGIILCQVLNQIQPGVIPKVLRFVVVEREGERVVAFRFELVLIFCCRAGSGSSRFGSSPGRGRHLCFSVL